MKYRHILLKSILIILCLIVFMGCISQYSLNRTEIITFKPTPRAKAYTMFVPVKYKFSIGGGHDMATSIFRYGKPLIYISFDMTMNWENLPIKKMDSIHNDILQNKPVFYCDTFVYSGIEKGRYWKEYEIYRKVKEDAQFKVPAVETLSIGYRYVSRRNKAFFDSCLLSVQPLANTSIEIDSLKKESLRKQEEWFASKKYQRIQQRSQKKFLRNLRRSK